MSTLIHERSPEDVGRFEKFLLGMFGAVKAPTWIWVVNLGSLSGMLLSVLLTTFHSEALALLYILLGCWTVILVPVAAVVSLLTLIVDREGRSTRETLVLLNLLLINLAPIAYICYFLYFVGLS